MSNRKLAVTKLRSGPVGRVVPFDLEKDGRRPDVHRPLAPGRTGASPRRTGKAWPKALVIFKRALDEALDAAGKTTVPRAGMPEVKAVDQEDGPGQSFTVCIRETPSRRRRPFSAAPRTPSNAASCVRSTSDQTSG